MSSAISEQKSLPVLLSISLLFMLLSACGGGSDSSSNPSTGSSGGAATSYTYQQPANIGDGWTVGAAGDHGMSVQRLEDMMDAIGNGEYPIIDTIAVASQGTLVFEETIRTQLDEKDSWVDNGDLSMHAQFSASKSIASILVGIAIDLADISSVDVPYLSLFDYPSYENWDERKNQIRLEHVLTMRTGLQWDEWNPSYSDPNNALIDFYNQNHDYSKGLLDLPLVADPGSKYAYNTIATVSLGQAIQNRGPLTYGDFFNTYLLDPLQITQIKFTETPTGLPDLGGGLYLYSRDMVKFGQVYMDDGQWNGQQIVSSEWVAASIQSYTDLGWSEPETRDWQVDGYGYQWWIGHFEHNGQVLPTYAALGYGQQLMMVIPDLELVIAVNSSGYEELPEQRNQVYELIDRFLLPTSQ
jgi:CubicO group peptidase (beta-lactamase class C family)